MTDQLSGEWFTQLIGLGHCLQRDRVLAVLRAIMRYNYREEDGLINASYPPDRAQTFSTNQNLQAMAPWTGIEYAMASMLLDFGMSDDATRVVRNVDRRYREAGRIWNHVECGDHYYRAMSSWAVLLGGSGFKLDAPRHCLTVAPRIPGCFRAPWVSATGYGIIEHEGGALRLHCHEGTANLRVLRVPLTAETVTALCAGQQVAATCRREEDLTELTFAREVTVHAGDTLAVTSR